ncbi:hypothetical protein P2318_26375 [Myxococcaceae bacterium GXIMD 01537]
MLRRAWPCLLLVLAVAAGCSRCGRDAGPTGAAGAPEVSRYLPRDARAAVVISDLGSLGEKLARFQNFKLANFLAQTQGPPSGEAFVTNVMRQLGVDLRSRQAQEAAGLDPARGAGVAFLAGNQAYSVLAVKNPEALKGALGNVARTRLGASDVKEEKVPGGTLVTYARGGAPQLGILFTEGFALMAPGATVAELSRLATLPAEKSLAREPVLTASLQRLPKERDFYVYLPGGGGLLPQATVQGLTLTGLIEERAVTLRADAPWPDSNASLAALDAKEGPDLLGHLPADSVLVMRYGGNPSELSGVWPYLVGPVVTRAVQQAGFDMRAEVLDNLQPGAAVGVALAPTVQLSDGMPALDLRRTNPFQFVHLVAVAGARDAAKLSASLEKVPPVAQHFGAKVEPSEAGGQRVYVTTYRQGEGAHFAAAGDKVVLAAPRQRLDAALAAVKGGAASAPVAADLKDALKSPVAVVLDLHKLAEAVKALPSEAWGIGGFAIKATTVRWLDALSDLRAVTLGLSRKEKALQAELSLKLSPSQTASTTPNP